MSVIQAPPGSVANIFEDETRLFMFPMFDFNGQPANQVVGAGGTPLQLPTDGEWLCFGVVATRLSPSVLPSGTNINFNIYDAGKSAYWFSGGSSNDGATVPLELASGKGGNIHYFDTPKLCSPGQRLVLYASHEGAQPAGTSPLVVGLICSLVPKGASARNITLESFSEAVKNREGDMYKIRALFPFANNNLADQASRRVQVPLNKDEALLVTGITARYTLNDDKDPRVLESGLFVQLSDARNLAPWVQPEAAPLALVAGNRGSRIWTPATFFLVTPGQDLVLEVTNKTGAVVNTDLVFLLHAARLKKGV